MEIYGNPLEIGFLDNRQSPWGQIYGDLRAVASGNLVSIKIPKLWIHGHRWGDLELL